MSNGRLSVIIPARDESRTIFNLVQSLRCAYPSAEIIVVDDGSTDGTGELASEAGATVIRHPYPLGNGAAIKAGARESRSETLVFMDADGQHSVSDLGTLLSQYEAGFDLVVGSRSGRIHHSSFGRWIGNSFYNFFASTITGARIKDLTSGFRVVNREKFMSILHLLPNKFSYPTTSTIAFVRMGFSVGFVDIEVKRDKEGSHIRPIRDAIRFFIIIYKVSFLFSPFKVLFPLAVFQVFLGGLLYLPGLFNGAPVFTNGMALVLSGGVFTLAVAVLSELITTLLFKN